MSQRILDAAARCSPSAAWRRPWPMWPPARGVGVATRVPAIRQQGRPDPGAVRRTVRATGSSRPARRPSAADVWAGFVRYFEESTEALVRDRGFRELVTGAYTASAGWARGSAPDRLYALFAQTETSDARAPHPAGAPRTGRPACCATTSHPPTCWCSPCRCRRRSSLAAAAARPDIYRRVLGVVLDGLRPTRSGPTPLPVPPLTDADLHGGHTDEMTG